MRCSARKLAGIEIGNEPDRFFRKGLRGPGWSFAAYRHQFEATVRPSPGPPRGSRSRVPTPQAANAVLPWLRASAALRPNLLTDHYYPLSSCGYTPVVSELLSPVVRATRGLDVEQPARDPTLERHPAAIDETNDISCKGQPGVSNTFAAALWAADCDRAGHGRGNPRP